MGRQCTKKADEHLASYELLRRKSYGWANTVPPYPPAAVVAIGIGAYLMMGSPTDSGFGPAGKGVDDTGIV